MLNLFTNFGSASGIAALGFNAKDFVIQLLSFLIVFLILKKYAFKPIIKIMDERKQLIESGVTLGEQMKKKNDKLDDEIQSKLKEAQSEADKIVTSAEQEARQVVVDAEEKARAKADAIAAEAKEKIKQDTAIARQRLEKELVGLITDATEAIIDEKIDAKKDAELIDRALKQKGTA
jgi:F-type H+-transporting ATPase subunit b